MQTNSAQPNESLDGSSRNGSPYPNVKLVDNRKFGALLIVIALIIAGVSLILRINDARKTESMVQVDGVVNFIDHRKYKIGRKEHSETVVSVLYVPEGRDMNYFVDGTSFMLDFAHKGDVIRVCYEKGHPDKAYIAEKDWLTGRYIHTGKGYNVPLIIAAVIILFGVIFIEDGVKIAKKKEQGYDPRSELEVDPKTGKVYDPGLHELTRYANRRRGYKKFWVLGSCFFTVFAGLGVGALVQYFTTEPRDPNLLIVALFSYLFGSGMLILVMITLIRRQNKRRIFVKAFMADEYTARYREREKAAQTLWKHVSTYMEKESPFSRFKLEYSRDWLEKYKGELKKYR